MFGCFLRRVHTAFRIPGGGMVKEEMLSELGGQAGPGETALPAEPPDGRRCAQQRAVGHSLKGKSRQLHTSHRNPGPSSESLTCPGTVSGTLRLSLHAMHEFVGTCSPACASARGTATPPLQSPSASRLASVSEYWKPP